MDINGFLESLDTPSTETLRAYRQTLERFEGFLREKHLRVTQVKPSTITEFISNLRQHKGRTVGDSIAPATVGRHLAVLSSFFAFLRQDDSNGSLRNPVDRVKRPKIDNDTPRAVDEDVLATLVNGITNVRDKAIVLLFIYSGLRLDELRQLDKTTIITRTKTMPDGCKEPYGYGEVTGKGRKHRNFIIGPAAVLALRTYVREYRRSADDNPALFLSSHRGRLSSRAIQYTVATWCKRLGISHIHVHQLRHSFATRMVNAGMSASALRDLLGHKGLKTTERYFRIKPERLTREYFSVMEFVKKTSGV